MMRRRQLHVMWLVLLLFMGQVQAATLRPSANIEHERIRLSDLFFGLNPGQDVEIGDAPALGQHYTVGGDQLTAIAAQFAVDWPDASPSVSVTLTRAARWVTEDDVLPLVRQALILPEHAEIDVTLENFKPLPVPVKDQEPLVLVQLEHPGRGEHFTARFRVPGHVGTQGTMFTVSGKVQANIRAVILRRSVRAGETLFAEDVTMGLVPFGEVPDDALVAEDDAVGLMVRNSEHAGAVLSAPQLLRPQMVHRGSPVVVSYHGPNVNLTVSGTVLEGGSKGDMVHVYNAASQMILTGRVMGRSAVDVLEGATPLAAGTRSHEVPVRLPTL
nr:flagellar basal body P-ring formation chaperone FlgA [uncultured Neokomagataea sp.]